MKRYLSIRPVLSILCFGLILISCSPADSPSTLILTNANVYTLSWPDPDLDGNSHVEAPVENGNWTPDAEAIMIRGKSIVYVGDAATALTYRDAKSEVLDLNGATVIPGLVDSHAHPYYFGEDLGKIDLTGLTDKESIISRLKERREESTAAEGWILGFGYDEGSLSTESLPTAADLSTAFPDEPVFIIGTHGFTAVANFEAMKRAGIDADTEAPVGGEIVKDENGEPNGIFLNNAAELVEEALPARTAEDFREIALYGMQVMAKSGYTALHDAGTNRDYVAAYQSLEDEGVSPVRVSSCSATRTISRS